MVIGLIAFAVKSFLGLAGLALRLLEQRVRKRTTAAPPGAGVHNHITNRGSGNFVPAHVINGDVRFCGTGEAATHGDVPDGHGPAG